MIDYENVVDAMLFEPRVAMLDGEMLEVEPCQFSDCMTHVMEKLRKAEKDAARYRWLRGQGCSDWEVDGVEVPHIEVTMWTNYGVDGLNTGESLHGDEMDSAIDCAMNKRDGGDL